jgi:hypothetical protein
MKTVTDTEGNVWNVYSIQHANSSNQIYPNHAQINIGKDSPERGITLSAYIISQWVSNEIKVKIRKS